VIGSTTTESQVTETTQLFLGQALSLESEPDIRAPSAKNQTAQKKFRRMDGTAGGASQPKLAGQTAGGEIIVFETLPELAEITEPFTAVKIDLAENPFPNLQVMLEHWRGLCDGRFAPPRDAFDPVAVPAQILPNIMMVDVRTDPRDFTYRYWGTGVVDLHGDDLTGKSVRDIRPAAFAEMVWQQYEEVVETKAPGLYLHKVPAKHGSLRNHAILRLPFSSDGEAVDIVMSVDDYCDAKSDLKEFFEAVAEGGEATD
jgi:hypothetical protein